VSARATRGAAGTTARDTRGPLAVTAVAFALGYLQKLPCHLAGWPWQRDLLFGHACYSDIPILYRTRGLADGVFPYASNAGEHPLEYPVLTGVTMDATGRLTRLLGGTGTTFFELTVLLLLGCALLTVWAVSRAGGKAYLVAAAPTLALAGTVNWDLLAVAAATLAILAWVRERPALAGACLGLGAAAKLYPALLLYPLLLVCLRERRLRDFAVAAGTAVASWAAVNAPVALAYPAGWAEFWRFNAGRPADFGSLWYALGLLGATVQPLDPVAVAAFVALLAAVALVAWRAPVTPGLAALGFLTVAAFCLTNKVYSPQYVLWLLPLAGLARVRVRDWAVWQAAEVLYWFAIWQYLAWTLTPGWLYPAATFVRLAAEGYLAVRVALSPAEGTPAPEPSSTSGRPGISAAEC